MKGLTGWDITALLEAASSEDLPDEANILKF
jgi:hypothetical protein